MTTRIAAKLGQRRAFGPAPPPRPPIVSELEELARAISELEASYPARGAAPHPIVRPEQPYEVRDVVFRPPPTLAPPQQPRPAGGTLQELGPSILSLEQAYQSGGIAPHEPYEFEPYRIPDLCPPVRIKPPAMKGMGQAGRTPPRRGSAGRDIRALTGLLAELDARLCASYARRAAAEDLPEAWAAEDEANALAVRRRGVAALIAGLGFAAPAPPCEAPVKQGQWELPPWKRPPIIVVPETRPGEKRAMEGLGQAQQASASFPASSAAALASLASSAADRASELVSFYQADRAKAAEAGIEVIGLELSVLLQSGALGRIAAQAQSAAAAGAAVSVQGADLEALRRAEGLLAEAGVRIAARIDTADSAHRATSASETACYIGLVAAVGGLLTALLA